MFLIGMAIHISGAAMSASAENVAFSYESNINRGESRHCRKYLINQIQDNIINRQDRPKRMKRPARPVPTVTSLPTNSATAQRNNGTGNTELRESPTENKVGKWC